MAMDIIAKDKKEIQWKGFPTTSASDIKELEVFANFLHQGDLKCWFHLLSTFFLFPFCRGPFLVVSFLEFLSSEFVKPRIVSPGVSFKILDFMGFLDSLSFLRPKRLLTWAGFVNSIKEHGMSKTQGTSYVNVRNFQYKEFRS